MRTRLSLITLLVAGLGASLACNAPPKDSLQAPGRAMDASPEGADLLPSSASSAPASSAPASSAPASSAPASPGKPVACVSDANCRTWSSYCGEAPCACRVLATADADPKCLGSRVQCFVDPCAHKVPSCQNGACVLTAK